MEVVPMLNDYVTATGKILAAVTLSIAQKQSRRMRHSASNTKLMEHMVALMNSNAHNPPSEKTMSAEEQKIEIGNVCTMAEENIRAVMRNVGSLRQMHPIAQLDG